MLNAINGPFDMRFDLNQSGNLDFIDLILLLNAFVEDRCAP